jgi:hypothetical protein
MCRVAANVLDKQSRTAEKDGPPVCGLGEELRFSNLEMLKIRRENARPREILWSEVSNTWSVRRL